MRKQQTSRHPYLVTAQLLNLGVAAVLGETESRLSDLRPFKSLRRTGVVQSNGKSHDRAKSLLLCARVDSGFCRWETELRKYLVLPCPRAFPKLGVKVRTSWSQLVDEKFTQET
jgi:hypothetical protein